MTKYKTKMKLKEVLQSLLVSFISDGYITQVSSMFCFIVIYLWFNFIIIFLYLWLFDWSVFTYVFYQWWVYQPGSVVVLLWYQLFVIYLLLIFSCIHIFLAGLYEGRFCYTSCCNLSLCWDPSDLKTKRSSRFLWLKFVYLNFKDERL
jgi:hypothetical protein